MGTLRDQSIAGAIMWVPGSIAFLLPVLWLVVTAVAAPKLRRNAVDAAGGQAVLWSR